VKPSYVESPLFTEAGVRQTKGAAGILITTRSLSRTFIKSISGDAPEIN